MTIMGGIKFGIYKLKIVKQIHIFCLPNKVPTTYNFLSRRGQTNHMCSNYAEHWMSKIYA